jgi:hypothetical protein
VQKLLSILKRLATRLASIVRWTTSNGQYEEVIVHDDVTLPYDPACPSCRVLYAWLQREIVQNEKSSMRSEEVLQGGLSSESGRPAQVVSMSWPRVKERLEARAAGGLHEKAKQMSAEEGLEDAG